MPFLAVVQIILQGTVIGEYLKLSKCLLVFDLNVAIASYSLFLIIFILNEAVSIY